MWPRVHFLDRAICAHLSSLSSLSDLALCDFCEVRRLPCIQAHLPAGLRRVWTEVFTLTRIQGGEWLRGSEDTRSGTLCGGEHQSASDRLDDVTKPDRTNGVPEWGEGKEKGVCM